MELELRSCLSAVSVMMKLMKKREQPDEGQVKGLLYLFFMTLFQSSPQYSTTTYTHHSTTYTAP